MKQNIYLVLLSIFTFLFVQLVFGQKMPKDFELTFQFGFHAEDATLFDSRKSKLIVQGLDTVMNFKIKLTKQEKQTIYNELQKINFIGYPEKYLYQNSDTIRMYVISPCQHYFLTVTLNNNLKTVEWDTCLQSIIKDEKHTALMTLDRVIEKIIWARNPLKDYHPTRMLIDPN